MYSVKFFDMESLPDVASKSKRPRIGIRQSLQLTHTDEEAKKRFSERLESLRQVLTPGSKDNLGMISKLMEIAEDHCRGYPQGESTTETATTCSSTFLKSAGKCRDNNKYTVLQHRSMVLAKINVVCHHSGVYTDESTQADQTLFVVEREAWKDLCSGLVHPCSCSAMGASWIVEPNSVRQVCEPLSLLKCICISNDFIVSMGMC